MGDMAKGLAMSPIFLVIVVVLILQFESQYLKNHKRYIQVSNFAYKYVPMTQCAVTC